MTPPNRLDPKLLRPFFSPVQAREVPIEHVNAVAVQPGVDEFFFTMGVVVPPEITPEELYEGYTEIPAKVVSRFAISRYTMEEFMEILQEAYKAQMDADRLGNDDDDDDDESEEESA